MSNGGLPHWLPEMVSVSPWTNDTYDLLYEIFRRDILLSRLTYRRHRVWFYPQSSANDKEDIFWHLNDTRGSKRESAAAISRSETVRAAALDQTDDSVLSRRGRRSP